MAVTTTTATRVTAATTAPITNTSSSMAAVAATVPMPTKRGSAVRGSKSSDSAAMDAMNRNLQTLVLSRRASLKMMILEDVIAKSKYDQQQQEEEAAAAAAATQGEEDQDDTENQDDDDDDDEEEDDDEEYDPRANGNFRDGSCKSIDDWEEEVMKFLDLNQNGGSSWNDSGDFDSSFENEEVIQEEKKRIIKGILCSPPLSMLRSSGGGGVGGGETNKRTNNNRKGDVDVDNTNNQTKPKKHVQFNEHARLKLVPHVNEMDPEDFKNVYMTDEDFQRIRNECFQLLDSSDFLKDGYLLRGLDKQTNEYRTRRDDIHYQVQESVFCIQELANHQRYQLQQEQMLREKQREKDKLNGTYNPEEDDGIDIVAEYNNDVTEFMAKVCAKKSEPAVIAAHTAAISDLFSVYKDTWTQRHIPTVADTDEDDDDNGGAQGEEGQGDADGEGDSVFEENL